jgi:hypothetical protein
MLYFSACNSEKHSPVHIDHDALCIIHTHTHTHTHTYIYLIHTHTHTIVGLRVESSDSGVESSDSGATKRTNRGRKGKANKSERDRDHAICLHIQHLSCFNSNVILSRVSVAAAYSEQEMNRIGKLGLVWD